MSRAYFKLVQLVFLVFASLAATRAQDEARSDTERKHLPATYTVGAEDLIRIRASTDESKSTVVEWSGQTLSYKPGEQPAVVFNVLGMNVARAKKLPDGSYDLLAREIELYLDPKTNEILHVWYNPFIAQNVTVIHVQNNPVYQNIPSVSAYTALPHPSGDYMFTYNIPLAYPNPLNPTNDPHSPFAPYQGSYQSKYSAIESFTFTFPYHEIKNNRFKSTPSAQIYWTRNSPLLPWMKSPDTNSTLLFVASGSKVEQGWTGLNPVTKDIIQTTLPIYKDAPTSRTAPGGGVTSWTFFTRPDVFQAYLNGAEFPIPETA